MRPAGLAIAACVFSMIAAAASPLGDGWSVSLTQPFRDVRVSASSEEAGTWPASKAADGITAEPEGIWQTLRDNPESAWLRLDLVEPRLVKGVRVYHQHNAGYYRSINYTIECLVDGAWRTVAEVAGNKQEGWRDHDFEPVEASAVRITITKSEHGFRMGLNEVALVYADAAAAGPRIRATAPLACGPLGTDYGTARIAFEAVTPGSAAVAISTRYAPDAGGKPGAWTEWSAPYESSPALLKGFGGVAAGWIQARAELRDSETGKAEVPWLELGWAPCVERVDTPLLLPGEGDAMEPALHFTEPMDAASRVVAEYPVAGESRQRQSDGRWNDGDRVWRFASPMKAIAPGLQTVRFGGARTAYGAPMMTEDVRIAVGREVLVEHLRGIAHWMMENPHNAIFVEGYNERTILALYEITGDGKYLAHVRKWVDWLLGYQRPEGYWPTGYGDVYLADTGSALGLLVNFYKFASPGEKAAIDQAFDRYVEMMLVKGDTQGRPFVHEDGSLGVGYHADKEGNIESDLNKPYTISTALTGAEIFAALYYMRGEQEYKRIAMRACDWLLGTMAPSGQIPYIIEDWNPGGENQQWVWERWPYDTAAYAGEGFLCAWTYIDDEAFRAELGRRVKPHIEWVIQTQNEDGSWGAKGSGDQLRSHGVVNMLLWYHRHVEADPRIPSAVRRWYTLVMDEDRGAYLKIPGDGIATSLGGRALADIIEPDIDCYRWKDGTK